LYNQYKVKLDIKGKEMADSQNIRDKIKSSNLNDDKKSSLYNDFKNAGGKVIEVNDISENEKAAQRLKDIVENKKLDQFLNNLEETANPVETREFELNTNSRDTGKPTTISGNNFDEMASTLSKRGKNKKINIYFTDFLAARINAWRKGVCRLFGNRANPTFILFIIRDLRS
jgi:hypothetical protein